MILNISVMTTLQKRQNNFSPSSNHKLIAQIRPAIRTLQIIKIEIETEE
jgi:hypothetical protein